MEPSEEIRRIIERFTRALAEGDHESLLGRLSQHEGTLMIGTDPAEWWRGREARVVWSRQLEEVEAFPIAADEIDAWEEGSIAWAGVKQTLTWGGTTYQSRATYVLRLERGDWKIVQGHWSLPQSNVEVVGRSLTVTLDELEETVQREQPDVSGALDSDGTVTIVFTDIVDSTVLLARLGDQAWVSLLRLHNAVIEETTATHGGSVVEVQGDGSMLAFPSARRAVACAQAVQREMRRAFADEAVPIRVRIGVHTGDALRDSEHFFGTTVHYAARVAAQALGGEVVVSGIVHDLVAGPGIAFHESREVELKGIDGVHRIFSVDLAPAPDDESAVTEHA